MGVDFDKLEKKSNPKPDIDFKGKIPKVGDKEHVFADNIKVTNEKEESSTSDEEKEDVSKTEMTTNSKRERTDSIDMPLFDSNSRDNHDIDKASGVNMNLNAKEASGDAKEPTESTNESKPISDDLAISDSDESNPKSRNVSDNEESKSVKVSEDVTKPKEMEIEDPDDYLLYLEDILKTVHKAYYELYDQMVSKQPDSEIKVPSNSTGPDLKMVCLTLYSITLIPINLVTGYPLCQEEGLDWRAHGV